MNRIKVPKSWILLAVFIVLSITAGAWVFTTPPNYLTNQTGDWFGNTSNDGQNYTADSYITNSGETVGRNISSLNTLNITGYGSGSTPLVIKDSYGNISFVSRVNTSDSQNSISLFPPSNYSRNKLEFFSNATHNQNTNGAVGFRPLSIETHGNGVDSFDLINKHVSFYTVDNYGSSVHMFDWHWGDQYNQLEGFILNASLSALYVVNATAGVNSSNDINIFGNRVLYINDSSAVPQIIVAVPNNLVGTSAMALFNNRAKLGYNGTSSTVEINDNDANKPITLKSGGRITTVTTKGNISMANGARPSCITMYSPDGTSYRFTIANGGTVAITAGGCDT